jgi:hypothetical protein
MPKLSRPHSFPSRPSFSLELRDIPVVRDILDVFLEVLPCFHMTMLSSSWVSWFSESLFSPRIHTGYPGLVGWAWTTTWRVERQKLYLTLFLLKGCLVFFVLMQDSISSLNLLSSQSLIWVWAIVKSNSISRTILMVFLLVIFTWVHHHFLWYDQYFCLVPTTYESIFLEHLNKLVVEPIDDILTFSMFEDIHIGY